MASFVVDDAAGWVKLGATQLPDTAVTPGTYGDATHVGQFTVDQQGRLTNASNVATGGGGTAGLVQLFAATLAVDTASIDTGAGGIAAGHGTLLFFMLLRTDEAGAVSNAALTFNADSGANYDIQGVDTNDTAASFNAAIAQTHINCIVHGSGGSAAYAANVTAQVPFYDSTSFNKSGYLAGGSNDGTLGNNWAVQHAFTWRNTAAISRATIAAAGASKLKAGSQLVIYGAQ